MSVRQQRQGQRDVAGRGRWPLKKIRHFLVALITVALLVKVKKIQEPLIIVVAGVVGIALKGLRDHSAGESGAMTRKTGCPFRFCNGK